jgi:hypothetical protein
MSAKSSIEIDRCQSGLRAPLLQSKCSKPTPKEGAMAKDDKTRKIQSPLSGLMKAVQDVGFKSLLGAGAS